MNKVKLNNLDIASILHPDDASTINKLNNIPGFSRVLDSTVGNLMERIAEVEYSGEGVDATSKSMPALHSGLVECCDILNITKIPALTLDWWYGVSAFAVGEKKQRIVLKSGTVDLLTADEIKFMIGRELGHILAGHKRYHMLTEALFLPIVNSDLKDLFRIIKMPLLSWYRYSDFTADRFGLLCCQDINVALSTLIKQSGLPKKYFDRINIKAFIKQAEEFDTQNTKLDKIFKALSINASAMPWLVLRGAHLLGWYKLGGYNEIISNNK